MNQPVSRPLILLLALIAIAPFVYALLFKVQDVWIVVLAPIISSIVLIVHLLKVKLNVSNSSLTMAHMLLWALILVGMACGAYLLHLPSYMHIPAYMGAAAAIGAIFSYGILPLVTLVVCIVSAILLFFIRNAYAANAVIFSTSFLALQIGGLIIFLPGAAAH
jgi:hypothetical protein